MTSPGEAPHLSVVLPAYNEERHIEATIEAVARFLDGLALTYEIVVADDGSTDSTPVHVALLAQKGMPVRLLRAQENHGKGSAVRNGMLAAQGRLLVFMDADLSYPVAGIADLVDRLSAGADIAIGSRALPTSRIAIPPPIWRRIAGRVYSLLIGLLLMRGFPDTQCGFKGFTRRAGHDLFRRLTLDGFAFDVELLFVARRLGYRIAVVPVELSFVRDTSKVRLLDHSIAMFLDLLRIRLNDIRGVYDSP